MASSLRFSGNDRYSSFFSSTPLASFVDRARSAGRILGGASIRVYEFSLCLSNCCCGMRIREFDEADLLLTFFAQVNHSVSQRLRRAGVVKANNPNMARTTVAGSGTGGVYNVRILAMSFTLKFGFEPV
jgi:hypothetical protein